MVRRQAILVTLVVAMLGGCASAPGARLATSPGSPVAPVVPAAPLTSLPAPLVRAIPGNAAPAPTVSVKAGEAAAMAQTPAVAVAAQESAADLLAADSDLEALELLAEDMGGYALQGWWQDLKDSVKRAWQRFTLKREVRLALKHRRDQAFELHEGAIDTMRKERTEPLTTINNLGGGGKEIVSTWSSTHKGAWDIETRRVVDADGVTQTLAVKQAGTSDKDLRISTERVRTLIGDNGAYKVETHSTTIYKDGRQEKADWTKTVNANGSEVIGGYITHRDGYRTQITGTRSTSGKVAVEVSKIAPAHNPEPLPSAEPFEEDDDATGTADEEATGTN